MVVAQVLPPRGKFTKLQFGVATGAPPCPDDGRGQRGLPLAPPRVPLLCVVFLLLSVCCLLCSSSCFYMFLSVSLFLHLCWYFLVCWCLGEIVHSAIIVECLVLSVLRVFRRLCG